MSHPNDRERLGAMVIGAILLGGAQTFRLVPKLRRKHFPTIRQQSVFAAFARLARVKSEINYGIVAAHVAGSKDNEHFVNQDTGESQIRGFLTACLAETPSYEHIKYLAGQLIDQSVRDRLVELFTTEATELTNDMRVPMESVNTQIGEKKDRLLSELMNYKEETMSTKDIIEQYDDPDQRKQFVPTGYHTLDEMLGSGLGSGELTILAARTSEGKTSLALNIALQVAQRNSRVLFVSIEMEHFRLIQRAIIAISGIAKPDGQLTTVEEETVRVAKQCISSYPIDITHDSQLTINKLRTIMEDRRLNSTTDLLIVDYLQLMKAEREFASRANEVSDISGGLKQISQDFDCPVLALAQLSRDTDKRVNKEPKLTDLRESGSIEQDADIVLMIQRQDQMMTEVEWMQKNGDTPYPGGLTNLHISKNRHGPRGKLLYETVPHLYTFVEIGRIGSNL